MTSMHGPLKIGIGGPVGTGKTALMDALCRHFRDSHNIAAITNDIYTREDAEFLTRAGSLPPDRIMGIETGGCPHTAIREDASINLAGVDEMNRRMGDNRTPGASIDSRSSLGNIPSNYIIGRVLVKVWPINQFKLY